MHRVSLLIALLLVVPAIPGFVSVRSASGGSNALVATGEGTSGSLFRPSQYLPLALPGDQRTDAFPQPPALWGHAMAYDAQSDRVILFGGAIRYVGYRDETWAYDFDTNTWSDMRPPTKPSARFYHGMTYDAQSDRVILWGGAWESDGYFYPKDDTWAYDFEVNGWTDMRPTKAPPARFWLAIAYDSQSDRVIQFGGREQFLLDDETWAYDFDTNTWTNMNPAQPPYAECPAIAYDSGSDQVVLFSEVYDERTKTWTSMTWAYDFGRDRWTNLNPATQPPTVWCHAMAYDAQSDRVILFGGNIGNSGVGYSDETWAYDFDTNTWTNMNPATRPSARAWHAMAYDAQSDRVILFGGYASGTGSNETWAYDFDTNTWTNMKLAQPPNRPPTVGAVESVPAVALPGQEIRLTASASDSDGDVLTYTWDFGDGTSATGATAAGGGTIAATHAYAAVGPYTVTLAVDDGKGGVATASTQVTVAGDSPGDKVPPVLNVPDPIVAEATGPSGAKVDYAVTAEDDVDGSLTPVCSPASGSVFPLGTTTVTCTARDSSGNEATATFTVQVRDSRPPVLAVPADMQVEATGPSGVAVTFEATAMDFVDPSPIVSCSPPSGSTFGIGTSTVTCNARDSAGNTATASFRVTVTEQVIGPPDFVLSPFAVAAVAVAIGVVAAAGVVLMRRRRKGRGPSGGKGGTP